LRDGQFLSIRYSIKGSSIKYLAILNCYEVAYEILAKRSRNLKLDGEVILKSSIESI